jgi:hypothetical protein
MKTIASISTFQFLLAVAVILVLAGAGFLVGQGSLTPPGAPAPMFKTLDQVEPRTPVPGPMVPGDATAVVRISQPGSYFLISDVVGISGSNGIEIVASDVTLDLNGFTVRGVPGSLAGIVATGGPNRIEVRNGRVLNWGGAGVSLASNGARCVDLNASANGAGGIAVTSGEVRRCFAENNTGAGITAAGGTMICDCLARDNTGHGIATTGPSLIRESVSTGNDGDAINVAGGALILRNVAGGSGDGSGPVEAELRMTGAGSHAEGNLLSSASLAISVDGLENVVVRNTLPGSGTTIVGASGDIVGDQLTSATVNTDDNPHGNYRP